LNLGRASLFSPILRVDELLGANGSGAASLDSFCQENTCAKSQHQVAQAPQLRTSRRGTSQQEQLEQLDVRHTVVHFWQTIIAKKHAAAKVTRWELEESTAGKMR